MKIGRQARIVDLIAKYDIETQEELADYLKKEGYRVTQATISRDIRELKLTKIATNDGRQKYALMQPQGAGMNEKYLRVLKDGFVSMDMAQNILVIKTVSGMAMAVAAAKLMQCTGRRWQGVSPGMIQSCVQSAVRRIRCG